MKYFVKMKDGTLVPRSRNCEDLKGVVRGWDRFYVGMGRCGYEEKRHAWFAYRNYRFWRRFGRDIGWCELTRAYAKPTDSEDDTGSFIYIDA